MIEDRPKTYAEKDIEQTMQAVAGDSFREGVLATAHKFKSGWVELAEVLNKVNTSGQYEAWGYKSLEQYCLKELHIRRATVAKLIGNYNLISRHEPKLLEKDAIGQFHEYDSIRPLLQAREDGQIDDELYNKLKEGALNKGYTAATVQRKLKESSDDTPESRAAAIRKRIKQLVHSIRTLLQFQGTVSDDVNQALQVLESHAEE